MVNRSDSSNSPSTPTPSPDAGLARRRKATKTASPTAPDDAAATYQDVLRALAKQRQQPAPMGSLFEVRRSNTTAPLTKGMQALIDAMAAPARRGRGRQIAGWRLKYRVPMLKVMKHFPRASRTRIAQELVRILPTEEGRRIPGVLAVRNWLYEISKGRPGFGRKP